MDAGWGRAGRGWDTRWAGLEVRLGTPAAASSGEGRPAFPRVARGACHNASRAPGVVSAGLGEVPSAIWGEPI